MFVILKALLCIFLTFHSPICALQTFSSYWIGDWQVSPPPTCDTTACCCFSNTVNIYASPQTSELYVNGTVQGICDAPVKQDNVNPPASLSFNEEFFGIDTYSFTLANSTDLKGLTITAADNSSSSYRCSFRLYRATTDLLFLNNVSAATPEPLLPSFASSYIGTWNFDTTCQINNSSCCCLVGSASVVADNDAESFLISAAGSEGCHLAGAPQEEDDFPWPTVGTAASSSVTVIGFLVNQDNYNIVLEQQNNGSFTLTFTDLTRTACSMRASRSAPNAPSTGNSSSMNWIWICILIGLVTLAPNYHL